MSKRVNHIFPSSSPHLSIPLIKFFKTTYYSLPIAQSFFLYGAIDNMMREKYKELEENGISYNCLETLSDVVTLVNGKKGESFIVHSDAYDILLSLSIINVRYSWVCWGAITSTSFTSIKGIINYLRWRFAFKRMASVVTLLKGDQEKINSIYRNARTLVMPYHKTDQLCYDECFQKHDIHTPLRVLVGNNGHCYNSYLQMLHILERFKDKIELHMMFQYPDFKHQKSNLRNMGKEIFGTSFYVDDHMMKEDEYYKYLSDFDVYICHDLSQTGLGAINSSLYFGKKVFLNGVNLSWLQYLGVKVYATSKISDLSFKEFCKSLTEEEKLNNKNIILKLWNQKEAWSEYLLYKA